MKTILGITILWLASTLAFSQEYRAPLSAKKMRLVLHNSEATIEGYDGNELIVQARGYEAPPERAEGLRPLYSGGTDNSGVGLSINEEGGEMSVMKVGRNNVNYEIKIPKNTAIIVEEVNHSGDDLFFKNLAGEIEVRTTNSNIRMENVTGPIVANCVSGNIDVVFANVNQQSPCSITVVSGDIDVTMPAQTPANLKLGSVSGEVYTNFEINLKNGDQDARGLQRMGMGRPIEGTINSGGVDMQVKSISGNIYLRKSE
uniref:DUF4097 family beta strand repeat-containing protein n=1 Tax=Roseihalotalea indica TaxID=2867963 RepID=A0AA49JFP6_9BACT|nr:DUF4097 family beta strand repeat-containing protein [Tunicatimonas sp. TK19036]